MTRFCDLSKQGAIVGTDLNELLAANSDACAVDMALLARPTD